MYLSLVLRSSISIFVEILYVDSIYRQRQRGQGSFLGGIDTTDLS